MRSTFVFVALLAGMASSCGGGSDSGTSGSGRSAASGGQCSTSSSASCAAAKTYQTCVTGKCDAPYKAAFGSGYVSGNFSGGACASLIACYMACPCDVTATSCEMACYTKQDATCDTAMTAITACVTGSGCALPNCSDAGTGTLPTTTLTSTLTSTSTATGSTTGSCAAVTTCCAKLTAGASAATYQQTCQTLASLGDAYCSQVLTAWQAAGVCQ